jgi:hypothetical protein
MQQACGVEGLLPGCPRTTTAVRSPAVGVTTCRYVGRWPLLRIRSCLRGPAVTRGVTVPAGRGCRHEWGGDAAAARGHRGLLPRLLRRSNGGAARAGRRAAAAGRAGPRVVPPPPPPVRRARCSAREAHGGGPAQAAYLRRALSAARPSARQVRVSARGPGLRAALRAAADDVPGTARTAPPPVAEGNTTMRYELSVPFLGQTEREMRIFAGLAVLEPPNAP